MAAIETYSARPAVDRSDPRTQRDEADETARFLVDLYGGEAVDFARKMERSTPGKAFPKVVRMATERLARPKP